MEVAGKIAGLVLTLVAAMTIAAGTAAADPWKDESGHGRWIPRYHERHDWNPRRHYREHRFRSAYKEEFRRGNCKIERKWDADEYKEEIKCKRGRWAPAYDDLY